MKKLFFWKNKTGDGGGVFSYNDLLEMENPEITAYANNAKVGDTWEDQLFHYTCTFAE